MIPLSIKDNVDPADSDNPYGIPRDRSGAIAGTRGNKKNFMDVLTLLDKIMAEADVVDPGNHDPNGLVDNDYNGWQVYEALLAVIKNTHSYDRYYVKLSQASTSAPTVDNQAENDFGVSGTLSYQGVGEYRITFPAGTFPDSTKVYIWTGTLQTFGASISVSISGDTLVRIRTADASDASANDLLNLTDIFIHRYA